MTSCSHEGPHAGAGGQKKAMTLRETCAGALHCWENRTLWKTPVLELFMKNCSPLEVLTLEKYVKNYSPWEEHHFSAGKDDEETFPWEGESSRNNIWQIHHNHHSPTHSAAWREEIENLGAELSPEKREGWRGGVFKIFYFTLSYSNSVCNLVVILFLELYLFSPQASLFFTRDRNWWVSSS